MRRVGEIVLALCLFGASVNAEPSAAACSPANVVTFSYGGDWSAASVSLYDGVGALISQDKVDSFCAVDGCYTAAVVHDDQTELALGISKLRAAAQEIRVRGSTATQLYTFCVAGDELELDLLAQSPSLQAYDEELERVLMATTNNFASSYSYSYSYASYSYEEVYSYESESYSYESYSYESYSYSYEVYSYESSYSYSYESYSYETMAPTVETPAPSFAPTTDVDVFSYLYSYLEYSFSFSSPTTIAPTIAPTAAPEELEIEMYMMFDDMTWREDAPATFNDLNTDKDELTAATEALVSSVLENYNKDYGDFEYIFKMQDIKYAAFIPNVDSDGNTVLAPSFTVKRQGRKPVTRQLSTAAIYDAMAAKRKTQVAVTPEGRKLLTFNIPDWYEAELIPTAAELEEASVGHNIDFTQSPKNVSSYATVKIISEIEPGSNIDQDTVKSQLSQVLSEELDNCNLAGVYADSVESEAEGAINDNYNCESISGIDVDVVQAGAPTPSPTTAAPTQQSWDGLIYTVCTKNIAYYGHRFEKVCQLNNWANNWDGTYGGTYYPNN